MTIEFLDRRQAVLGIFASAAMLATGTVAFAEEEAQKTEAEEKKEEPKMESSGDEKKKREAEERRELSERKAEKKIINSLNVDAETKAKIGYCSRVQHTKRGFEECLEVRGISVSDLFPNGIPIK